MWVFVDESGDTGDGTDPASTDWFVIAAVVFESEAAMEGCEQRFAELRRLLRVSRRREFHFTDDGEEVRRAGLRIIAESDLHVETFEVVKQFAKRPLPFGNQLHAESLRLLFRAMASPLKSASVKLDGKGDQPFRNLKRKAVTNGAGEISRRAVRKVKSADSKTQTLLQVADYVAGAVSHDIRPCGSHSYVRLIKEKIRGRHTWPPADQ